MSCKKVLICGSAEISKEKLEFASRNSDVIVAADGGYDRLHAAGIIPDIILGDMDSIAELPENIKNIRYPIEKDLSDLEICLEYVAKNYSDCEKIVIAGVVSETRLDHTFSNVLIAAEYGKNISIICEHSRLEVINTPGQYSFKAPRGSKVSIISLKAGKIYSEGLKFKVVEELSSPSHGISNEVVGSNYSVIVKSGSHLLISF
jgi:thiamine pyrophosphokinase